MTITAQQRGDVWDMWLAHKNTAQIGRLMDKPEHEVEQVVHSFMDQLWKATTHAE